LSESKWLEQLSFGVLKRGRDRINGGNRQDSPRNYLISKVLRSEVRSKSIRAAGTMQMRAPLPAVKIEGDYS
jgi:hypothetical protein